MPSSLARITFREGKTRAMRQAVDAFMAGVSAEEYAKDHYELAKALETWGNR